MTRSCNVSNGSMDGYTVQYGMGDVLMQTLYLQMVIGIATMIIIGGDRKS